MKYAHIFDKDEYCIWRISQKRYAKKLQELDFAGHQNTAQSDVIANELTEWVRDNAKAILIIDNIIKTH